MSARTDARTLLVVCSACAAWATSFGVGSQVISHWLAHHSYRDTVIGLNHTVHYLGLGAGSLLAPVVLRRWGRACPIIGMLFSAVSLAAFPFAGGVAGYFGLRLVNGIAGALTLIPLETALGRGGHPDTRSRSFACYGVALTLGGAVGIWLGLYAYVPGGLFPFFLGGGLPLFGAGIFLYGYAASPVEAASAPHEARLHWRRNFLAFGTAWCQGFLEGGMLAFLSLYLLTLDLTADAAGALVGLTMAGVIVFQVPVSWLADRVGRVRVLLGCYAVVAATLWLLPQCGASPALAVGLFAFGACAGAMYPLGLSLLGDGVSDAALPRAYAWYLAMECIGSQLGAAAMGQARDAWGEASMFALGLAAVAAVLAAWGVLRLRRFSARRIPAAQPRRAPEKLSMH